MLAGHASDNGPRLRGLLGDGLFLGVTEVPAGGWFTPPRITVRRCRQAVLGKRFVSTGANGRAGGGMKMRPPVDLHFAVVQPVTPFAQARRRQKQRGGIIAHAHSALGHRLDMHRPERLNHPIAHVCAHGAVPPDIPAVCAPHPRRQDAAADDQARALSGGARDSIRSASHRCAAMPCSRNVSKSPPILPVATEPDIPRYCIPSRPCKDRTIAMIEGDGKIKASRLSLSNPLTGLVFRRAGRSGRVPRRGDVPMLSMEFPAPIARLDMFGREGRVRSLYSVASLVQV